MGWWEKVITIEKCKFLWPFLSEAWGVTTDITWIYFGQGEYTRA